MDVTDNLRLELAANYRREVEVLYFRVKGMMKAIENNTDEEIALEAGIPGPVKIGAQPPTWIEGPLRAAQDSMTALAYLNLARYRRLEEEQKTG